MSCLVLGVPLCSKRQSAQHLEDERTLSQTKDEREQAEREAKVAHEQVESAKGARMKAEAEASRTKELVREARKRVKEAQTILNKAEEEAAEAFLSLAMARSLEDQAVDWLS